MNGQWAVHAETSVYTSEWVSLHVADVEKPSGVRHPHHLVRIPHAGAGAVIVNAQHEVLLIHRHRFIPDRWGWELPAGRVDPDEDPIQAAVREVREETGWLIEGAQHLCTFHNTPGISDQLSHVILARATGQTDDAPDADETDEIRWWPRDELAELVRSGGVSDAFSLTGLLWYLQFGR